MVETGESEGTLLKSMALDLVGFEFWPDLFTSNQHLLAFCGVPEGPGLPIFIVRMDSLLDESKKTAEEVEINQISLISESDVEVTRMCMNTTTLFFTTGDDVVIKKEFWVGPDHPQIRPWLPFR